MVAKNIKKYRNRVVWVTHKITKESQQRKKKFSICLNNNWEAEKIRSHCCRLTVEKNSPIKKSRGWKDFAKLISGYESRLKSINVSVKLSLTHELKIKRENQHRKNRCRQWSSLCGFNWKSLTWIYGEKKLLLYKNSRLHNFLFLALECMKERKMQMDFLFKGSRRMMIMPFPKR